MFCLYLSRSVERVKCRLLERRTSPCPPLDQRRRRPQSLHRRTLKVWKYGFDMFWRRVLTIAKTKAMEGKILVWSSVQVPEVSLDEPRIMKCPQRAVRDWHVLGNYSAYWCRWSRGSQMQRCSLRQWTSNFKMYILLVFLLLLVVAGKLLCEGASSGSELRHYVQAPLQRDEGSRKDYCTQEQYEKIRYNDLDLDSLNGFQSKPGTVISNSANTAPINRFRTSQTSDAQRYPFASIGCCVYVTLQPQEAKHYIYIIYVCMYTPLAIP